MRVAVLTLTRDRLAYTQHCFDHLERFAGCDYDHYILDQGSQDGTVDWLRYEYVYHTFVPKPENIGISKGINTLLDIAKEERDYDAIIKLDNDCELTTENVVRDAAQFVIDNPGWAVSPQILGLNNPVGVERVEEISGQKVGITPMIGGIFFCVNGAIYDDFRHSRENPTWGMDDVHLSHEMKKRGNTGYLMAHEAWHYETTKGQEQRFPDYFDRKEREGKR